MKGFREGRRDGRRDGAIERGMGGWRDGGKGGILGQKEE